MRLLLQALCGTLLALNCAQAVALYASDRNRDGRSDYLSVSAAGILDERIDSDFDGYFDSLILSDDHREFTFRIGRTSVYLESILVRHGLYVTLMTRGSSRSKFQFVTYKAADLRQKMSAFDEGVCDSRPDVGSIEIFEAIASQAKFTDTSCGSANQETARIAARQIRKVFEIGSLENQCWEEAIKGAGFDSHAIDRLNSAFRAKIDPSVNEKFLFCEVGAADGHAGESEFQPLKIILKSNAIGRGEVVSGGDIAVHELAHLLARKECSLKRPSSTECLAESSESRAQKVVASVKSCLPLDSYKAPPPALRDAPLAVPPTAVAEGGISSREAQSAVPVIPAAASQELTFVKPNQEWIPTPPRIAEVTRQLGAPALQYAERVWAEVKPKVESELAMLPRAGAGEGRAQRSARAERRPDSGERASTGTKVSQRNLDADTSTVDVERGRGVAPIVVGTSLAPDKRGVEGSLAKTTKATGRQDASAPAQFDAGDSSTESRTATKGASSRRGGDTTAGRTGRGSGGSSGSAGIGSGSASRRDDDGEEPRAVARQSSQDTQAGRGPAAINRSLISETERRIISSLETRKVQAISGRDLIAQLSRNPNLQEQLKKKGIAIVDNSGGRWGADYKKATHKYLVRGETITDMSD